MWQRRCQRIHQCRALCVGGFLMCRASAAAVFCGGWKPGALPSWDWTMVDASCLSCVLQQRMLLGLEEEITREWKVTVYHPITRDFGDWKWLVLSLWQLNWEPLLSAFLGAGSLIKHVFPPPIYLKCRFLKCRTLCTMEEHCKWGSLCHPMLGGCD